MQALYNVLDAICAAYENYDLTEGIYSNPETGYKEAQQIKRQWLLDKIRCGTGTRFLDIGCGYGSLLAEAESRGAEAVGITLSKKRASYCKNKGLTVYTCNYRDIKNNWKNSFDCIAANGSIEHFVRPADALTNRQNIIYREFFSICHELINPNSPIKRLATSAIHFDRFFPNSFEIMKGPWKFPRFSDKFHAALLLHALKVFYPVRGQLIQCADSFFTLEEETEGTEDYRLTSEQWLNMKRQRPVKLIKVFPYLFIRPKQLLLIATAFFSQSWQWQFRGNFPPMRLWRHLWKCL